jgi:hypothetical protein
LINKSVTGDFITEKAGIMKLQKCSLFVAIAAVLLLAAALAPRANATLIVYFNFEDEAPPPSSPPPFNPGFDGLADVVPQNPGGGIQNSTLTMNGYNTSNFGTGPALAIAGTNRTALDNDLTNNSALVMNRTAKNDGAFLEFNVNTLFLSNLSLSFAVDNNGNGFNTVTLSYSSTGNSPGSFTQIGLAQTITTGSNILITGAGSWGTSFNVTPSAGGFFRLTFSGGQSNGNNRETAIDNIQLGGTAVPEPATVASGLLGVIGLCWFQRRRLIDSFWLRRRRA